MERQFLIKFLISLILVGCQQIAIVEKDKELFTPLPKEDYQIPADNSADTYKNIWDYLLANNLTTHDELINEQVLYYMNTHIKDTFSFNKISIFII